MELLAKLSRAIKASGPVHALRNVKVVQLDVTEAEVVARELLLRNFLGPIIKKRFDVSLRH